MATPTPAPAQADVDNDMASLTRCSPLARELRVLLEKAASGALPVETLPERRLLFRVAAALSAFEAAWGTSAEGDHRDGPMSSEQGR